MYNPNYYKDDELWTMRPKLKAINVYTTIEGIKIGMFQGSRGQFPDIDFVLKILKPGIEEKLIPPPHSFWVVDLMMKTLDHREEVVEIIEYYLKYYESLAPFNSPVERENYKLETVEYMTKRYAYINHESTLSMSYIAIIIELFCKNEKRNSGAYMFLELLKVLLSYAKKESDYMSVILASQPGFRK
jgi:hypothetical protein